MAEKPTQWRKATIEQWPATSWLDPIDITRTGLLTVLAGLFGSFADKRETLAALYPSDPKSLAFDHTQGDDVWFDYICDTGDGWNPTYSIAYLVGQDSLAVENADGGDKRMLPRGAFMVLGGDQVYPVASADTYRNRLEGPYFAARPQSYDKANRIPVYALPGNHDWYDGLTSFIRLFCHRDRWVAQWTATQSRSYFALKLPHKWWVWGLDVQLESDLDVPQVDYFKRCADLLGAGDRVIIVSPEPTWIKAGQDREQDVDPSHRNMLYLESLIHAKGADIPVKIAGDLHHYARYEEEGGSGQKRQLITCGGGGAFLHGTYGLPPKLLLKEAEAREGSYRKPIEREFGRKKIVPSESQSKALRLGVIRHLIPQNPWFAVAVGCVYWVYSWLLQSASEALNTLPWTAPTLLDYLRTSCRTEYCPGLFLAWWDVVIRDPRLFIFTAVIVGGCGMFALVSRRASSPLWKKTGLVLLGLLHGCGHIALALLLMDWLAQCVTANWFVHFMTLPTGAIPGALLMSIYLLLASVLFEGHDQEVLSTQAIADYKCFTRFHVTKDTVTIYPIGLETVCKEWELAAGIEPRTYKQHRFPRRKRVYRDLRIPLTVKAIFEPVRVKELTPRLLEAPIVVNWPAPTGSP